MPTSIRALKKLLQITPESLSKEIYDIGSGFGFVAYLLAKKYPNAKVIGVEISLVPYWISKVLFFACPNLTFERGDFQNYDLSKASLIYCYLFPKGMERLAKMDIPCLLISNTFAMPGKKIEKTIPIGDLYQSSLFLYQGSCNS